MIACVAASVCGGSVGTTIGDGVGTGVGVDCARAGPNSATPRQSASSEPPAKRIVIVSPQRDGQAASSVEAEPMMEPQAAATVMIGRDGPAGIEFFMRRRRPRVHDPAGTRGRVVTRLRAPNPSPMTLEGTNGYVVRAGPGTLV